MAALANIRPPSNTSTEANLFRVREGTINQQDNVAIGHVDSVTPS
jgi:hypothetical protein